ncbi:IS66 family transposase [Desulfosarcina ovata]|uniref:Transposase IS66 central domain-containing protein n=1 Tax=Desulfosarcina ovata subsp. ovata TaxID=2752305 RepID=A0A5K8A647_9BACT|nr:transposase [Desulfosarcina ovata]BBO87650.1 hypothetical protein DSCOOX_08300 [Desulfosarcina ovata subsp. ovata]
MNLKEIFKTSFDMFLKWPKVILVKAIVELRDKYLQAQDRINQLEKENAQLKRELEQEKIKNTNKEVNKPSSKQAEWEKGSEAGKDKGKKKPRGRKRKPRKGAGNRPKNKTPNREETATVDKCDLCGKDLSGQAPLESTNERIVEDIVAPPEETIVTLVTQQKKYCADCQAVITAKLDLALPGADIGLNATVLICYLWVALCLPYPKIKEYLKTFYKLSVSTSGLSRHVIKVARIMHNVHDEILNGIKHGTILHADETGWRVRGKNWWLWVFGTPDTAYFTVDKTRGVKSCPPSARGNILRSPGGRWLGRIFILDM